MKISPTRIAVFSGIALASGWIGLAVDKMTNTSPTMDSPGAGIWIATPLLTVAALRLRRGGWKTAGLDPRFSHERQAYAIALVAPLAIGGLSTLIGTAAGGVSVEKSLAGVIPLALAAFGFNVIKNIFEEFAWRGYLSNHLTRLGMPDIGIYLLSGLVWGAWHLPYYIHFLNADLMANVADIPRVQFGVLATVVLTGWSIAFAEMYRLSGTVWTVVLMHTMHNSFVDPLQVEGFTSMSTSAAYVFSPVLGVISVGGYVALGLWLRRLRIQRESLAGPLRESPAIRSGLALAKSDGAHQ